MDLGLMVTFAGILVAGVAGVLGVWMERDRSAPTRWAWVFSSLIVVAVCIEMVHSLAAEAEEERTEERMASVLQQLSEISAHSNDPALKSFVGAELAAQARNNPEVLDKVGEKVAANGGDPDRLRRQAQVARRTAAGLPARRPEGAARPGSKSGSGAGGSKSGSGAGGSKAGKGKNSARSSGKSKGSSSKKSGKGKNANSKGKSANNKGNGSSSKSNRSSSKSNGSSSKSKGSSSKSKSSNKSNSTKNGAGKKKGGKKGGKKKR